jgi:ribosomal protein L12E/L44/L45/RPP1/RPP2
MSDPPPLAKMLLVKLQGLDDYAQSKVTAELAVDGASLSSARLAALLKTAGIATTPSQVRALVTHLGGSSDGGVTTASFAALVGADTGLDARSSRTSVR